MLTGQSGLGKSTLMNTLFKSKVSRKSVLATAQEKIPKTIEIKSVSHGKVDFNPSTPSLCIFFCQLFAKIFICSDTFFVFTLLCSRTKDLECLVLISLYFSLILN